MLIGCRMESIIWKLINYYHHYYYYYHHHHHHLCSQQTPNHDLYNQKCLAQKPWSKALRLTSELFFLLDFSVDIVSRTAAPSLVGANGFCSLKVRKVLSTSSSSSSSFFKASSFPFLSDLLEKETMLSFSEDCGSNSPEVATSMESVRFFSEDRKGE